MLGYHKRSRAGSGGDKLTGIWAREQGLGVGRGGGGDRGGGGGSVMSTGGGHVGGERGKGGDTALRMHRPE